jgi:hypothetical protein
MSQTMEKNININSITIWEPIPMTIKIAEPY